MSIGRNDPCPCGSGKKYKKCCALKASIEPDDAALLGKYIQTSQNQSLLSSPWYQSKWESHRQKVTKLLFAGKGRNRILLIGPGNCNDFDLLKVGKEFKEIDLVDIDSFSVMNAVKKLPVELQAKFHVIEFDITGIYGEIVPKLIELMPSLSPEQLEAHLMQIYDELKPTVLPQEIREKTYDAVAILAVFTQLFMPFYETKVLPNYPEHTKRLRALGIKLSDRLAELAFDSVIPILKKGTQFTFYSDILQFNEITPILMEKLKSVDTALGHEFVNRRIVGSDGILRYIDQHLQPMAKYGYLDSWIWEFDQQRKYYTIGITFTNPN